MNKEDIKEYLKRMDELELKLIGEDKDTYQWVLFGYNQCAKLLNETQRENQKLEKENQKYKEVIDKAIEYILKETKSMPVNGCTIRLKELLDILKEAENIEL